MKVILFDVLPLVVFLLIVEVLHTELRLSVEVAGFLYIFLLMVWWWFSDDWRANFSAASVVKWLTFLQLKHVLHAVIFLVQLPAYVLGYGFIIGGSLFLGLVVMSSVVLLIASFFVAATALITVLESLDQFGWTWSGGFLLVFCVAVVLVIGVLTVLILDDSNDVDLLSMEVPKVSVSVLALFLVCPILISFLSGVVSAAGDSNSNFENGTTLTYKFVPPERIPLRAR